MLITKDECEEELTQISQILNQLSSRESKVSASEMVEVCMRYDCLIRRAMNALPTIYIECDCNDRN